MSFKIDFSKCEITPRKYGGANGNKIGVIYNNEKYLLKFPIRNKKKNDEYSSGCISEYIGSQIFNLCGIEAQETILGEYNGKLVVACKDFRGDDEDFYDFASIKNSIIDSERCGYSTNLDDILTTIDKQNIIPSDIVKKRFWDMFIVDTLLGNFDRHNGNWGFLHNRITNQYRLAPVFDCGSCLFPQIFKNQLKNILENEEEIKQRVYVFPRSAIKQYGAGNEKINPFDFLTNTDNKECIQSLKEITKKINLEKIKQIIFEIPVESNDLKLFFNVILKQRKEKILDCAIMKLENTIAYQVNTMPMQEPTINFWKP